MNRRDFARTSAGLLAALAAPGVWAVDAQEGNHQWLDADVLKRVV